MADRIELRERRGKGRRRARVVEPGEVLLVARPAQAEGQVEPIGGMPDHVAEHRVCPGVTGVDELLVPAVPHQAQRDRSEEHTSELQSLMRISYAVFCLKKKK